MFNNLIQATQYFSNKDVCVNYLTNLRWAGNVTCVFCEHEKCYTLKGATKRFKCASCRKQFSATKGTIFENSAIPLQKWFIGIYLLTSHKKGISSLQLSKDLGITQKSAWFMLQRIRFALQTKSFNKPVLDNIVEMDETVIGGKAVNIHIAKKVGKPHYFNKSFVFGMVERHGKVVAQVVKRTDGLTLKPIIKDMVSKEAFIFTDKHGAYYGLNKSFKGHYTVDHDAKEYARGNVHTNTIEGFWSLLKRGIVGIYHQVSVKHLDMYVDEFEFRYNTKDMAESSRFDSMLSLSNKRLTYAKFIA